MRITRTWAITLFITSAQNAVGPFTGTAYLKENGCTSKGNQTVRTLSDVVFGAVLIFGTPVLTFFAVKIENRLQKKWPL